MTQSTKKVIPLLLLFLSIIGIPFSIAQETAEKQKRTKLTRVRGTVIDKETKEPLPFVNIAFAGTTGFGNSASN